MTQPQPDPPDDGKVSVLTTFFEHPIRVFEDELAALRGQGLIREDPPGNPPAGPPKPAAKPDGKDPAASK